MVGILSPCLPEGTEELGLICEEEGKHNIEMITLTDVESVSILDRDVHAAYMAYLAGDVEKATKELDDREAEQLSKRRATIVCSGDGERGVTLRYLK